MEIDLKDFVNNIFFILGPTGVGKTKLSLTLADKFHCSIINSDAFSLYKHADIMTAKASIKERTQIKHYLIDILDLEETNYKILNYTEDCLRVINDLFNNNISPIIVGGTNYYVQNILFDKLEDQIPDSTNNIVCEAINDSNFSIEEEMELKHVIKQLETIKLQFLSSDESKFQQNLRLAFIEYLNKVPPDNLYKLLSYIDPNYHKFLHKKDSRRIINGIVYYYINNGKRKSDKLAKEFIKLRFKKCSMIFLNPTNFEELKKRIESRINDMIKQGGMLEILSILYYFYKLNNQEELNFTEGILQAIGYKEFYPLFQEMLKNEFTIEFLNSYCNNNHIESDEFIFKHLLKFIIDNKLENVYEKCLQTLVSNTIKYAKSQLKFIKKRIIPFFEQTNHDYLELKISNYSSEEFDEYIKLVENFVTNKSNTNENNYHLKHNFSNSYNNQEINEIQEKINKISLWNKYNCDVCNVSINGDNEFKLHFKSNKHKKKKKNKNKKINENINNKPMPKEEN